MCLFYKRSFSLVYISIEVNMFKFSVEIVLVTLFFMMGPVVNQRVYSVKDII